MVIIAQTLTDLSIQQEAPRRDLFPHGAFSLFRLFASTSLLCLKYILQSTDDLRMFRSLVVSLAYVLP